MTEPSTGKKLLVYFLTIGLAIGSFVYLYKPQSFISPLASNPLSSNQPVSVSTDQPIIFGFLPYWNLKAIDQINLNPITHLAYFGITFNNQGNIDSSDLGFRRLNQFQILNTNSIIVLRALDNDLIDSLTATQASRNRAINNVLNLLSEYNFSGINIDFEYSGIPEGSTKRNFTLFVNQLSATLRRKQPKIHISIDMYADAVVKDRLWQIKSISRSVDYIIIMAYDFHRPSSQISGPVAPLHSPSAAASYNYNVSQAIADYAKLVPTSKLILAIPYYGYQWQTTNLDSPFTATYPHTGALATLNRIYKLLTNPAPTITNLETHWDQTALSPYLTFKQDQKNFIIWYENPQSLALKYQLAKDANLAGIAIWALGYAYKNPKISPLLDNLSPHNSL